MWERSIDCLPPKCTRTREGWAPGLGCPFPKQGLNYNPGRCPDWNGTQNLSVLGRHSNWLSHTGWARNEVLFAEFRLLWVASQGKQHLPIVLGIVTWKGQPVLLAQVRNDSSGWFPESDTKQLHLIQRLCLTHSIRPYPQRIESLTPNGWLGKQFWFMGHFHDLNVNYISSICSINLYIIPYFAMYNVIQSIMCTHVSAQIFTKKNPFILINFTFIYI